MRKFGYLAVIGAVCMMMLVGCGKPQVTAETATGKDEKEITAFEGREPKNPMNHDVSLEGLDEEEVGEIQKIDGQSKTDFRHESEHHINKIDIDGNDPVRKEAFGDAYRWNRIQSPLEKEGLIFY